MNDNEIYLPMKTTSAYLNYSPVWIRQHAKELGLNATKANRKQYGLSSVLKAKLLLEGRPHGNKGRLRKCQPKSI